MIRWRVLGMAALCVVLAALLALLAPYTVVGPVVTFISFPLVTFTQLSKEHRRQVLGLSAQNPD